MNLLTFLSDPPMNITVSVNPERAVEGSIVNLTCSCETAADAYTWYRRTLSDSSSPPVRVGSGKTLSLVFVRGLHPALYFCNVRNKLGESNSTEVMLAMPESSHGWCLSRVNPLLLTFKHFYSLMTLCLLQTGISSQS